MNSLQEESASRSLSSECHSRKHFSLRIFGTAECRGKATDANGPASPLRLHPARPRPDRNRRIASPSDRPPWCSSASTACTSTRWSHSWCTCGLCTRSNRRETTCSLWRPCSGRTPDICSRKCTAPWTRPCSLPSSRSASADAAPRSRFLPTKTYH